MCFDALRPKIGAGYINLKKVLLIIGTVVGLIVIWNLVSKRIPSYVEYRGQQIKLSRYYLDYDGYKNDPDNIDPSETSRVQRLVSEAPIDRSFRTEREVINAAFDIKFPGYGVAYFADGDRGEHSLRGFGVEIPRADKFRYFTFECTGGRYLLVDQFIAPEIPLLNHVRQDGGNLVYSSDAGEKKFVRPFQISVKTDSQ